jgi:hypothetical protein
MVAEVVEREPKVRDWFAADELERCSRCGQNTALKVRAGSWIICTECGPVGEPDVSLHASALSESASLEAGAG